MELDNLAAETAATMTTKHPDYAILAARIAVSNLHKETKKVFSGKYSAMQELGDLMMSVFSTVFFHKIVLLQMSWKTCTTG